MAVPREETTIPSHVKNPRKSSQQHSTEANGPTLKAARSSSSSIEDYEVGKAIGKGKFSVVYKGKIKSTGESCALKKIAIFDSMDEKSRNKCLKEVRILENLSHPNIIQYLDSFVDDKELVIVFEWADAGDLKRQIRKARERHKRFDERVIWKYFRQITSAVQHMHKQRVMHRDIKPANIFLTLQGTVKVGDLGLGRYLSEQTMEAFSKVGTPLYMSPEVLKGKGYDWKSDIWSLGCILYELAMLKSPFKEDGLSLHDLFHKIDKGHFNPVSDAYSQDLRELTNRMISLDPSSRPNIDEVCSVARQMYQKLSDIKKAKTENKQKSDTRQLSNKDISNDAPVGRNEQPVVEKHTAVLEMEKILDNLKLLEYENEFLKKNNRRIAPFTPLHFAVDSTKIGANMNRYQQFQTFIQLAAWLLSIIGYNWHVDDMQAPNMLASSLLVSCQKAGIDMNLCQNLSPSLLTPGHGFGVCKLLLHLTRAALRKEKTHFPGPIYEDEGAVLDASVEREEESISDDQISEDDFDFHEYEEDHRTANTFTSKNKVEQNLLPILNRGSEEETKLWKIELERVIPKLVQARKQSNDNYGYLESSELIRWRQHLKSMRENITILDDYGLLEKKVVMEVNNDGQKLSTSFQRIRKKSIIDSLSMLAKNLEQNNSSISKLEKRLNLTFGQSAETYSQISKETVVFSEAREKLQQEVDTLSSKYFEIENAAYEIQEQVKSKGEHFSDTQPLQRIRKALKDIHLEITEMDMKIELLRTHPHVGYEKQ